MRLGTLAEMRNPRWEEPTVNWFNLEFLMCGFGTLARENLRTAK
jgi:hypothetical protein